MREGYIFGQHIRRTLGRKIFEDRARHFGVAARQRPVRDPAAMEMVAISKRAVDDGCSNLFGDWSAPKLDGIRIELADRCRKPNRTTDERKPRMRRLQGREWASAEMRAQPSRGLHAALLGCATSLPPLHHYVVFDPAARGFYAGIAQQRMDGWIDREPEQPMQG